MRRREDKSTENRQIFSKEEFDPLIGLLIQGRDLVPWIHFIETGDMPGNKTVALQDPSTNWRWANFIRIFMKNKSFDFWPSKKMSYEERSQFGAGDVYGEGQKPKVGAMRQSYVGSAKNKGLKFPKSKSKG